MKLGGWQIPILVRYVLGVAVSLLVLLAASLLLPVVQHELRLICLLLGLSLAVLALITLVHARRSREDRTSRGQPEGQRQAHPEEKPAPKPPIPKPPAPDFEHPYPLQANFTGRVAERRMLTEWLTTDSHPVLALVAIGGMGKSALTWAWVQRDVLGLPLPGSPEDRRDPADPCRVPDDARPDGILWWSFYERDSTFEAFLNAALIYASGGGIVPPELPSTHDRMQALYNLLREKRFLVVMDGFERILRPYARLDAAYIGETFEEDERGDFRSCADPNAGRFLQDLAAGPMKSRVLITSRLLARELEDRAGCREEELPGMDPQDGVSFMHAQGVTKATRAEIEAECAQYDYHPLALRLLAGVVANDKRTPGDIRVAARHPVLPELKGKEQHHILKVSYDTLDQRKGTLLSRIAAFRSPMAYIAVAVLNPYEKECDLDSALQELVDRGLLLFDRKQGRYDLHPIVRQYAYERLADKKGVHTRLRDYFASAPELGGTELRSVEDLSPTIELYRHTVGAGLYDEAFGLFRDRLSGVLYYRFGAYQTCVELLRALFPDERHPPRLKSERDQSWAMNELANSYSRSGQSRRAAALLKGASVLDSRVGREGSPEVDLEMMMGGGERNLAVDLVNLADAQVMIGEVRAAEGNLRRSIELSRQVRYRFGEAVGREHIGHLLSYRGALADSGRELDAAWRLFAADREPQPQSVVESYRALRALLMGDAGGGLRHSRRALELCETVARERHTYERDIVRAGWLLGWSLTVLASKGRPARAKRLAEAENHLTAVLTRCRRINLVELEPEILLAWARWHRGKGERDLAKKDAQDALSIADRCEYRLVQADCHNFLALLALDAENREEAASEAQMGYERARCDGPPYSYKPALDEAKRLLKTLGAPLPKMKK